MKKQPLDAQFSSELQSLIDQRVDIALDTTFRLELASENGPMSRDERREILRVMFGEIAIGMGFERFLATPVERLDQFAVMSMVKNHDTRGLLVSLVNSFMIAYSRPETVSAAYDALVSLEALREQIADSERMRPRQH